MLVQIRLLLDLVLLAVLRAIPAAFHRPQSLVDAFVVVACRAVVICLTRFPLEALEHTAGKEEDPGQTASQFFLMVCQPYLSLALSLRLRGHPCRQLRLVALRLAGVSSSSAVLLVDQEDILLV